MDFTDHPFLNVMWTFFIIFVWISWFSLVIGVVVDVFRNGEMRGASKALWLIVVAFVPVLGVLAYLIAHGDSMGRRRQAAVATVAGAGSLPASAAEEIERAQRLRDSGAITDAEFQTLKARALA